MVTSFHKWLRSGQWWTLWILLGQQRRYKSWSDEWVFKFLWYRDKINIKQDIIPKLCEPEAICSKQRRTTYKVIMNIILYKMFPFFTQKLAPEKNCEPIEPIATLVLVLSSYFFAGACPWFYWFFMSFCPPLWNFNLANNFWTVSARALIFYMSIPCDKTFL